MPKLSHRERAAERQRKCQENRREWEERNPKPVVVVRETMEEMKALMMMEISQQPAHLRVYPRNKTDKYGRDIKLTDPNGFHKAKVEQERLKAKQERDENLLSIRMEQQRISGERRKRAMDHLHIAY